MSDFEKITEYLEKRKLVLKEQLVRQSTKRGAEYSKINASSTASRINEVDETLDFLNKMYWGN